MGTLSKKPPAKGRRDKRAPQAINLKPCGRRPNCVSSLSDNPKRRVDPLAFNGPPSVALRRLIELLNSMPRVTIVQRDENYLRAEFVSAVFRFVDDVEFAVDPKARVIHVRSASRVGYHDLGVNRRRVEAIRTRFKTLESR